MGGDGRSGKGNLVKIIVFLGPEGSPVGVIEAVNVPIELFAEIPAEGLPAPGAPAEVASLVAQLVVGLPGGDLRLVPVMARHGPDDFLRIRIQLRAVVAANVASAKGPGLSVLKPGEDIRVFARKPCGNRGGRRAQDDLQVLFPGLGDDAVKKGEVILPLDRLHQMPGELGNPDCIAPHLPNDVHIGVHQGGVPLLGVVVNAQQHRAPLLSHGA